MAKIATTKPALIMLYGYPGSGKTYFARQFAEGVQAAHVQGDRIRAELFEQPRYDKEENNVVNQLMMYMTESFLEAGLSVVYDINSMRARQRLELRELARRCHAVPVVVWFQVDLESSFARSIKRDRRRADDKYSPAMDRATFDDLVGHMQNPKPNEDFVVVSGKHTFNTQFSALARRMRELGMLGSGDANSKAVKPGLVNLVPNPASGRVDMTRRNIVIR
ncbi:ATP-binding protein [Candidatus Saccharibacteria bacterium]|nr:ATP-binding protein [Candidatus Saccharibacteria bacterium]